MSIFGIVGGALGNLIANLDWVLKGILMVGGIILLSVGVAFLIFGLKKYRAKRQAEKKENLITRAAIFGGLGAIMVFFTSPVYAWVTPYESLACSPLGCGDAFNWLPLVLGGGLILLAIGLWIRKR